MELSYYFYSPFESREETEAFLIDQAKIATDYSVELKINRHEESEEGEGDTLDFSCRYFAVDINFSHMKEIEDEYNLKINYGLWLTIYPNGTDEFIRFIGKLLDQTDGDALLIDENYHKIIEKKNQMVHVNNYVFQGKYELLGVPFVNGVYKFFLLQINIESPTNYMIQDIKPIILELANNILMKSNFKVLEELDYPSYFSMVSNEYKIDVTKGGKTDIGQLLNISCGDIYTADDRDKLNDLMRFFERIIQKYEYEFQLLVTKGYYTKDYVNLIMMERKKGEICINNNVEESNLLKGNNSV